eukprot:TRINITY_DN15508_c0_g1_i1.p1 TRINITY_DN15508_c0_g1~~TRINITY_DN15508_c0_g1_i1.p1  ORF type:complete len:120 (-),score=25.05 TRINITY_DN15508_c0_g1_i1:359-718(-)
MADDLMFHLHAMDKQLQTCLDRVITNRDTEEKVFEVKEIGSKFVQHAKCLENLIARLEQDTDLDPVAKLQKEVDELRVELEQKDRLIAKYSGKIAEWESSLAEVARTNQQVAHDIRQCQ